MAVTIKDLARAAGVSHTTVSRALHDNPALSKDTIVRVKELAEKMGYVPNATARGLKTRRTLTLGVIVAHIDDPFWSEVMHGVDDVLHQAGYSFFVSATHRDAKREKEIVRVMEQRGVDGVILLAPQFAPEQALQMKRYGLPMAIVNNEGAGEYDYLIYNDDVYGIQLVTRHLTELGHKKIAFLGNQQGGSTNSERLRGFLEFMQTAHLSVRDGYVHNAATSSLEDGFAGAKVLLSQVNRPTAIVCYNDNMAVGVFRAAAEAGLRIPQDLSVTGFDDISIAAYLNPPLTTLHQHKYNLGSGAAQMMLEVLEQKRTSAGALPPPKKVGLKGELVIRGSTAVPGG